MFDWIYIATLVGTLLVLVAAFSSLVAFRFGAPLLLLFLGIGLAAGVDGLGISFANAAVAHYIGPRAPPPTPFAPGFGTSLQSFRQAAAPAVSLATVGVLLTTTIFGTAAHYLLGITWLEGFLLGAIVGSTDAAAVFFLLRGGGINIRDRVRSTLEIESSSNDPMAIFLTITLVEIIATGGSGGHIGVELLVEFVREMGIGLVAGVGGGAMIATLVNRLDIDRGLAPIFVLALSLLVFSVTGAIGGSGFLAVFVAGIYAGNRQIKSAPALRSFQEGASWLAQIIMFVLLGLLATPSQFQLIAVPAILLALFLCLVARPVAVWLSLVPFEFARAETLFLSWVGLRGAVSILLAIVPLLGGLDHGTLFFNTAFIIVLVSLLVQGWTIGPLAKWLNLIVPPRIGPVEKLELELPGTAHHELLVYRVVAGSPVARGERIPRWARPSLVIRDGQSKSYQYAGRLQAGDYVYLFISARYPRLLDRLFASPAPVAGDDADFFGAFSIDPARTALDLQAAYGIDLRADEQELTIAELMTRRLGGRAEYADRVALGPVDLIVRDVDEQGRIESVGVSLEPEAAQRQVPMFLTGRELAAKIRGLFGRRRDVAAAEAEPHAPAAPE